jgi:hypothetical protein
VASQIICIWLWLRNRARIRKDPWMVRKLCRLWSNRKGWRI